MREGGETELAVGAEKLARLPNFQLPPGSPAPTLQVSHPRKSELSDEPLSLELAMLQDAGVDPSKLKAARALASRYGLAPATVVIRSGLVSHQRYLEIIAAHVGAHALSARALGALKPAITKDPGIQVRWNAPVMAHRMSKPDGLVNLVLAPGPAQFGELSEQLQKIGTHVGRIVLVTPGQLRRWLIGHHAKHFALQAEHNFWRLWPVRSARNILTKRQLAFIVLSVFAAICCFTWAWGVSAWVVHVAVSSFFTFCVVLRLAIIGAAVTMRPMALRDLPLPTNAPIYTVLVALYDEANQAADLVAALTKLHWPAGRLEIKFITEAKDRETIQALRVAILSSSRASEMEVLVVPYSQLRTKPRALNFALPLTRGDFVVLYDAEDRPHPQQLLEAYEKFSDESERLACLQSPLTIRNGDRNALSMMFALEYAALFQVLLPAMARMGLAFPLGGTSNHFRRSALEAVGGWDPHNVTEDADLGLRLARHGYVSGVLHRPTFEEAPVQLGVWIRQRTRWLKGWTKTWLIHLRQPIQFVREAGVGTAIVSMAFFGGTIAASLLHPWIYAMFILYAMPNMVVLAASNQWLLLLDLANIAIVFIAQWAVIAVALNRVPKDQQAGFGVRWWWPFGLPLYWLACTCAAWRAIGQLFTDPHRWEKTPHGL